MTDLVEVWVRTRHPEHYVLVNEVDGSQWRIVDGRWKAAPVSKREADRTVLAAVVARWSAESVVITDEPGAVVSMADLDASLYSWAMFGEVTLPGSKTLAREVLSEHVTAAGAVWDTHVKQFTRMRLV
jgi:hypothetical protein